MGPFERLLGRRQGGPPPQQQRQEFQDFVGRYEQGAPWTGISDQEAVQRYQQVAPRLSPLEYFNLILALLVLLGAPLLLVLLATAVG